MRQNILKALSVLLVICIVLPVFPITRHNSILLSRAQAKNYQSGDIITFGRYPQRIETDKKTIAALNTISKNWISYQYYSGEGKIGWDQYNNPKNQAEDYMHYADVTFNNTEYRAVLFNRYRPASTVMYSDANHSCQNENGYFPNEIYYFKYEPLKWRVLNPVTGLVLCESIIDSQAFQNCSYYCEEDYTDIGEFYLNASKSAYAHDYEKSTIRSWLSNSFYNVAFSTEEQANIKETKLDNGGKEVAFPRFTYKNTSDFLFLPSYKEVTNASYGFNSTESSDSAREARGTDYAKCQGLGTYDNGKADWMLRTPSQYSGCSSHVNSVGAIKYWYGECGLVMDTCVGIRPAFCFKDGIVNNDSQVTIPDNCKIIVNNNHTEMPLGSKKQLSVKIENPKKQKLLYSSSDPSIVSVSVVGVVTANAIGTATITVQTYDKQHSVTCEISVVENSGARISLSVSSLSMDIGDTKKLNAVCKPSGLSLLWGSSNTAVVTVDGNGFVKAAGEGSATVTVTIKETNVSASASVTVTKVNDAPSDATDKVIKKNINKKTDASKGNMEVELDPQWFSGNSKEYNHGIAEFASEFATIGYSGSAHIKDALAEMGFPREKIEVEKKSGRDEQNFFIAQRPMKINGREYVLLFVGMIGSEGEQWNSDFDPLAEGSSRSDSRNDLAYKTHLGFMDAKNYVKDYLVGNDDNDDDNYYDRYHLNPDNTILLITGHSRGAAAANLFAAEAVNGALGEKGYKKYANLENIYAYTFATPSAVYSEEPETELRAEKYNRIFNIVNPEDFVTWMMPSAWHYGRYGQVIVLPSKDNCPSDSVGNWNEVYSYFYNKMTPYYSKLTGGDSYQSFGGEYTVYSLIEKMTKTADGLDAYYHKPLRTIIRSTTSPMGVTYKYPQEYNLFQYFQDILCPFVNDQTMQIPSAVGLLPKFASGDDVLCSLTSFFFKNNVLNQCFAHAHMAETYCAFMESMKESDIVDASGMIIQKNRGYFKFRCPVDITVIDPSTGESVASITNNILDVNNIVSTYVEGNSKTVVLPSDCTYEILITGNDNGYLDYTYFEINQYGEEVNRINYFDIPVVNGMVMSESTVYDDEGNAYTAIIDGCGEEVGSPQTVSEEEYDALTVELKTEGIGSVSGAGQYTAGDYVTLSAATDENNSFLGFYENGELVTKEATYSIVVKESRNLTAKFTDKSVAVSGVKIEQEKTEFDLTKDPVLVLPASVQPTNATEKQLIWTSSDESVASVTEFGIVELKAPGKVTLTASTPDGKYNDSVTLTITDAFAIPGDVDGDGNISAADARLALRRSVGLEDYKKGSPKFLACDVDLDGNVSAADARLILRASVGLEDPKSWVILFFFDIEKQKHQTTQPTAELEEGPADFL